MKNKADTLEYMSYNFADVKTLLLDIDGGVRGLGGCKKPFDLKDLPSYEKYNKNNSFIAPENETEEERLARHRAFFESLKNMVQHEEVPNLNK